LIKNPPSNIFYISQDTSLKYIFPRQESFKISTFILPDTGVTVELVNGLTEGKLLEFAGFKARTSSLASPSPSISILVIK
jgi:ADP-sugar diphosphatase